MTEHFPYFSRSVGPAEEPVSASDAKAFLRISGSAEDTLVARLIVASREAAESYLQRSLVTQTWKLSYDDYTPSRILLPRGPIQSIISVKLIARDGSETTVDAGSYYLNSGKELLVLDSPLISHMVEITYVTGYGAASAVPSAIRQGMFAHIAEMYEKRAEALPISRNTQTLYQPYRVMSF